MLYVVLHRNNVEFPTGSVIAEHQTQKPYHPHETITATLADLDGTQIGSVASQSIRMRLAECRPFADDNGGSVIVESAVEGKWRLAR